MNDLLWLARRFWQTGRRRSLRGLAVLIASGGIVLAGTFVLVGIGILGGFQKAYEHAVLDFNAHVILFREGGLTLEHQQELEGFLDKRDGVAYSRYAFFETLVPTDTGLKPVVLKGIDLAKKQAVYPMLFKPWATRPSRDAYIGKDLAAVISGIKEKGTLGFLSLKDKNGKLRTRTETIPLAGEFSSGLYDFDAQFVLMDMQALKLRFGDPQTVDGYEVHLQDPEKAGALVLAMNAAFKGAYSAVTWQELNGPLLETLTKERRQIFLIAVLVLAIACLNILGFCFLFFLERKSDFLVLAALGLSVTRLRHLLTLVSLTLAGASTLLAVGLGALLTFFLAYGPGIPLDASVYFVDRVPMAFKPAWFVGFFAAALGLSFLASQLAGWVIIKRNLASELVR